MRCLMIYRPEANPETAPPPSPEHVAKMGAYIEEMSRAGVLLDTGGLAPSSRGVRLRLRRGKLTVTDGPFTESKELIAGFAIMQLASLAEAKERARQFLQLSGDGENEIRVMHEPSDWDPQLPKPALTRYMFVWRPDPDTGHGSSPSPALLAMIEEERESGVLVASEGLEPSARGARVRRSKGKVTITDGPFTEAKELIAGYALVNVASIAEAKEHARSFLEIAGDGESEIRVAMEPPAAA